MLALTIFCVVAVALTTALQQTVDASIILRDESQVRLELQNLLDETSCDEIDTREVGGPDGRRTSALRKEIRAVQAKTARGVVLPIYTKSKFKPLGIVRSGPVRQCGISCLSTMRKTCISSCISPLPCIPVRQHGRPRVEFAAGHKSAQGVTRTRKKQLRKAPRSGYLLLEVLLALSVLSIVVVMVFQIIQTTLKVTSDINFLQTATTESGRHL